MRAPKLLTRDDFREAVFARDSHKCVMCGAPAADAHHIIERKLWPDGGYYLENGASVCGPCHLKAEQTLISCEELRSLCRIQQAHLPPHMDASGRYDKWGNPYLDEKSSRRTPGELFYEESVQAILAPVLMDFTYVVKYPRTFHLPWSPGATNDDRIMASTKPFEGRKVVVTVKMDGENTSLYQDFIHARALSYTSHESRGMMKALWQRISHDIPARWRICGENLLAVHSIKYKQLDHFFQVFSIWNEWNVCLSWEETAAYAEMLGLSTVPVLYQGEWDESKIRALYHEEFAGNPCEGYVVRVADSFRYSEFRSVVGKYVRPHHVQTDEHWMTKKVEFNEWTER